MDREWTCLARSATCWPCVMVYRVLLCWLQWFPLALGRRNTGEAVRWAEQPPWLGLATALPLPL